MNTLEERADLLLCQSLRRRFSEGCEAIVYSVWMQRAR